MDHRVEPEYRNEWMKLQWKRGDRMLCWAKLRVGSPPLGLWKRVLWRLVESVVRRNGRPFSAPTELIYGLATLPFFLQRDVLMVQTPGESVLPVFCYGFVPVAIIYFNSPINFHSTTEIDLYSNRIRRKTAAAEEVCFCWFTYHERRMARGRIKYVTSHLYLLRW